MKRSGKQQLQPTTTHMIQKRLSWYGHVIRRYGSHITRTVLDMEVGVRPRGRTKLRYKIMNTIRRDMKKNEVTYVTIRLEIGSRLPIKGDPLTWKSLQGDNTNHFVCENTTANL